MSIKSFLIESSFYDITRPVATLEDIRKFNSQRFEMEQLTGILYENAETKEAVGYKQVTENEFWVRGHMPGYPIMPGIVMCEVAAQLASYFVCHIKIFENAVMGFAGLEEVKFRGIVRPGDNLIVQAKLLKLRNILVTASFMGIVDDNIVCEGVLKGFPLKNEQLEGK